MFRYSCCYFLLLYSLFIPGQLYGQSDTVESSFEFLEERLVDGYDAQTQKLFTIWERALIKKQDWDSYVKLLILKGTGLRKQNSFDEATKVLLEATETAASKLRPNSKTLASAYRAIGNLYNDELMKHIQGLNYYLKSLEILKQEVNTLSPDLVRAQNSVGNAYKALGKFEQAKKYYSESLEMVGKMNEPKLHHNTLYSLGEFNLRVLEYDSASAYFEKAIEIWNHAGLSTMDSDLADTFKGLGWVYSGYGDYDKAIDYELKALAIYEEVHQPNHAKLGLIHIDLSYEFEQKNDYDQALQHTNQALNIYQNLYHKDHPSLALVNSSIGHILYNQSQYFEVDAIDQAIVYYQKALRIDSVNYPQLNSPKIAVDFHRLGLAYKFSGQYRKALKYILITKDIQETLFGKESLRLINTINNVGAVYIDLKAFDSARMYFNEALAICEKQNQEATLDLINIHKNLADSYNFEANHNEALKSINQSLSFLGVKVNNKEELQLPSLDQTNFKERLIYILPRRAEALLGLYLQTDDRKYLEFSLNNDLILTEIYTDIVQNSKSKGSQLVQIPSLVGTYENAIFCQTELHRITNDDSYIKQAFNLAEKSKAILLLMSIKEGNSKKFTSLPQWVQDQEDSLKSKLNEHISQVSSLSMSTDTSATHGLAQAQNNLLKTRYQYDQFVEELKAKYPKHYNLNYLNLTMNLEELQHSLLVSNEAVIEYVVGKERIFGFLITPNSLELQILNNREEIANQVITLRDGMLTNQIDQFNKSSHHLYEMLFQPFEDILIDSKIDHVNIVADDFLGYIPFEALIRSNPGTQSYKQLDYLLKHFCFNYNYSATLRFENQSNIISDNQKILAFAPTFQGKPSPSTTRNAQTLTALPHAQAEVKNILSHFKGTGFSGGEATETNFKKMAGQFKMLHLATHALTDDERPDFSRLYFSQKDSLNDGLLYAYELYGMDLNADLVTLSACNTGVGKFYKGEGIASLAMAFRYAGCPNVIMSLWAVSDESTSKIMSNFYQYYNDGLPKADALWKAKLSYLESADANTADPYHWAAFTLIGNSQPIVKSARFTWQIASGVLLLLISVIYILMRRRS